MNGLAGNNDRFGRAVRGSSLVSRYGSRGGANKECRGQRAYDETIYDFPCGCCRAVYRY